SSIKSVGVRNTWKDGC
ncbi:hypothetical protein D030_3571B, partial [Vibrio parahaemolyticus AQ3810]